MTNGGKLQLRSRQQLPPMTLSSVINTVAVVGRLLCSFFLVNRRMPKEEERDLLWMETTPSDSMDEHERLSAIQSLFKDLFRYAEKKERRSKRKPPTEPQEETQSGAQQPQEETQSGAQQLPRLPSDGTRGNDSAADQCTWPPLRRRRSAVAEAPPEERRRQDAIRGQISDQLRMLFANRPSSLAPFAAVCPPHQQSQQQLQHPPPAAPMPVAPPEQKEEQLRRGRRQLADPASARKASKLRVVRHGNRKYDAGQILEKIPPRSIFDPQRQLLRSGHEFIATKTTGKKLCPPVVVHPVLPLHNLGVPAFAPQPPPKAVAVLPVAPIREPRPPPPMGGREAMTYDNKWFFSSPRGIPDPYHRLLRYEDLPV
jgi:hypothetical protein